MTIEQTLRTEVEEYDLRVRTTKEDWLAVADHNPVALDLDRVKRWAMNTAMGARRAMIVTGEAGCGKSHAIDQAMKAVVKQGVQPIRAIVRDDYHLLELFKESGGTRPIILEESDSTFKSKNRLNILKMALDDSKSAPKFAMTKLGRVTWGAPVLIALNTPLSDEQWKLRDDIDAIASRTTPVDVRSTPMIMWEYACYLAIGHNLIRYARQRVDGKTVVAGQTVAKQNAALRFYTEHLFELRDRSPRGLTKVMECFALAQDDKVLRSDLQALLKAPTDPVPAGWPLYVPVLPGFEAPVSPSLGVKAKPARKEAPAKRKWKTPPQLTTAEAKTVVQSLIADGAIYSAKSARKPVIVTEDGPGEVIEIAPRRKPAKVSKPGPAKLTPVKSLVATAPVDPELKRAISDFMGDCSMTLESIVGSEMSPNGSAFEVSAALQSLGASHKDGVWTLPVETPLKDKPKAKPKAPKAPKAPRKPSKALSPAWDEELDETMAALVPVSAFADKVLGVMTQAGEAMNAYSVEHDLIMGGEPMPSSQKESTAKVQAALDDLLQRGLIYEDNDDGYEGYSVC